MKEVFRNSDFSTLRSSGISYTVFLYYAFNDEQFEGDSYPLLAIQIDHRESYMQSIHVKLTASNRTQKCLLLDFFILETQKDLERLALLKKIGLGIWVENYNIVRKRVYF